MVPEDDTAFPKETRESLMSKTNLPGHGFQRPARCIGGFRSLKNVFGPDSCHFRLIGARA